MASRSLDACLGAAADLARLLPHAAKLQRLQAIYERCAPPELAGCARVVNLKSGTVRMHAASGAVAAKLKQLTPRLAREFLETGLEVRAVEVRVRVTRGVAPAAPAAPPREPMGAAAKRSLTEAAARLPAGSPLREALERLIERA